MTNTNTNQINSATITTKQIHALAEEALAAGDYNMEDICSLALAAHETSDSQGFDLIYDGERMTRTMARQLCAEAINDATNACDTPEESITSAIEGLVIASIEHSWLDQAAKLRSLTNPDTGGPVGGYAYQHAEAYLYESLYNNALVWIAEREGVKTHPLTSPESSL